MLTYSSNKYLKKHKTKIRYTELGTRVIMSTAVIHSSSFQVLWTCNQSLAFSNFLRKLLCRSSIIWNSCRRFFIPWNYCEVFRKTITLHIQNIWKTSDISGWKVFKNLKINFLILSWNLSNYWNTMNKGDGESCV